MKLSECSEKQYEEIIQDAEYYDLGGYGDNPVYQQFQQEFTHYKDWKESFNSVFQLDLDDVLKGDKD